jgi:TonB family protein
MVRVEQRCLLGSAGFHVALLLLLLLTPKISTQTVPGPVLTIIPTDLKVTDGDKAGGGSPDARPPAQSPIPRTAPVQAPELLKPVAKPVPATKPEPVPEPEKPEKVEKKAPPKPREKAAPVEQEKKINTDVPSQDTAPTAKKPKKTIKTSDAIKTADTPKKFNREELAAQRREAEEAEAERAAESRRRARAAQVAEFNAERARLAGAIGGAASVVGKSLAGSATIEMPGPGGQAYAPYRSYLAAFYKERWRNKPSAIPANSPGVMVEIVIARDGRLVDWRVTQGSGSRELDQSIKDLIPRYPKLLPLPEGSTDPQRTFRILFTLEADTPS